MTSSIQVSEEMLEAGREAFNASYSGDSIEDVDHKQVTAIYLAMKAAEPLPQGDEVERVATAVMRCIKPHLKHMIAYSNLHEAIRAALARSKLPMTVPYSDDHLGIDKSSPDPIRDRVAAIITFNRNKSSIEIADAVLTAIGSQSIEPSDATKRMAKILGCDFVSKNGEQS